MIPFHFFLVVATLNNTSATERFPTYEQCRMKYEMHKEVGATVTECRLSSMNKIYPKGVMKP